MIRKPGPALGLAITTIGRPAITNLLESAAESTRPPNAVAIANQSGGPLPIDRAAYPFPVTVRPSSGGASAGRNHAAADLPDQIRIIGFPNDDSVYPSGTLEAVVDRFGGGRPPAAVACSRGGPSRSSRTLIPTGGSELDRYTIWRAIEWTMFVDRALFTASGGFRVDLGTGSSSPWQSGEGTDLLLRLMSSGGRVVSAPGVEVWGAGERRDLSADEFVHKLRGYARGTGRVYRLHRYPLHTKARIVIGPWLRLRTSDPSLRLALRIAFARSVGRFEGLTGRPFGDPRRGAGRWR